MALNQPTTGPATTRSFADLARRLGWRIAVAGGLLVPGSAWADDQPEQGEAVLAESATKEFAEDSVLIATRQVDEAAVDSTLEPISQHSEQTPELADPLPATPPAPAAEALPTAATPAIDAAPTRVATKPSNAKPLPPSPPVAKETIVSEPVEAEPIAAEPITAQPIPTKPRARAAARFRRPEVATDPSDVASAYEQQSRNKPARFHGVLPGVSTGDELIDAWGDAEETSPTESGEVLLYDMPPFAGVEAMIEEGVVAYIKVELDNQQEPERLAQRLRLDDYEPVEILDEAAEVVVGLAYPEKGMLLMLAKPAVLGGPTVSDGPESPQFVTHMVIQPLEAEEFALRADQADFSAFEEKLADLRQAVRIDPDSAYANWQLAELHLLTGAVNKASRAAAAATQADPESDAYRLCWAECLTETGDYDRAVLETREVLDSESAPSVVKAGALHLMGRLASKGESGIADKAIGFQTMAIEVADTLATSVDRAERLRAKRLLVDANLAVALEISRRKYARKDEIVGQWIGRASGIAEQMIEAGESNLEIRLIVAREALAALANLKPAKDPSPWVTEAEEAAGQLLADNRDALYRSRIEWQLGQTYFHALRVEHSRKQVESGLGLGKQAIGRLKAGAVTGDVRPAAESLVGRLYFHIGALHAVHKQDHAQAVKWYDKAEPLLSSVTKKSELEVPRRRGEALVSMAVSYWDQGQRDRAVGLTVAGSELMEDAVAGGVLDEKALAVPYGNLSTMHRRLGDRTASAQFAKLARGARGAEPSETPSFAEAITKAAEKTAKRKPAPAKQAVTPKRTPTDRSASRNNRPTGTRSANSRATGQRNINQRKAGARQPNGRQPSAGQPNAGQRSNQQRTAARPTPTPESEESTVRELPRERRYQNRTRKPATRGIFR
ncbi:MAG: hypothetical protein AAGB00_07155 [Planctomycetota bacterium]